MSDGPLRLALVGPTGRMGKAILDCAAREPAVYHVSAEIRRGADVANALAGADVIIDFSLPAATAESLLAAVTHRKPLVLGTTGHDDAGRASIMAAAREVPLVFAANFSVGVNTLFWLTRRAAEALGPGFDLEIVEMHHRHKRDAPSGTARRLAEILAEARALSYATDARHGREGNVGERPSGEIGVHAVRGGDIVGEHTVFFAGVGERVELTHRASSRETFALGALRAARWLAEPPGSRPPGLYDMEDVLGFRS